jgi:transcriptional regulator with XRE-family HTH domain
MSRPDTSARLREARLSAGITQVQLAAALGIAQDAVSKAETGSWRLSAQRLAQMLAAIDAISSSRAPGGAR